MKMDVEYMYTRLITGKQTLKSLEVKFSDLSDKALCTKLTEWPAFIKRSTKWDPTKPAPPVTRTLSLFCRSRKNCIGNNLIDQQSKEADAFPMHKSQKEEGTRRPSVIATDQCTCEHSMAAPLFYPRKTITDQRADHRSAS
jgi:hypothetical protein